MELEIKNIRNKIFDRILIITAICITVMYFVGLINVLEYGWGYLQTFYTISTTIFVFLGIFRERIKLNIKFIVYSIMFLMIGTGALYNRGLVSGGYLFFSIPIVISVIIFGKRAGIYLSVVALILYSIIGIQFFLNKLTLQIDLIQHHSNSSIWIMGVLTLMFFFFIITISSDQLYAHFIKTISLLKSQRDNFEQEVNMRTKELKNTHTELKEKNEVLTSTLDKLNITLDQLRQNQEALLITKYSVDNSNDIILWIDPSTAKIISSNAQAHKKLGYSEEEFLSFYVYDFDPVFNPDMWSDFSKEMIEKGSLRFETKHKTKDGYIFPVEISAVYVEYEGKKYFCAISRDITERIKAEKALTKSNEDLTYALNKLKDTQTKLVQSEKMASLGVLTAGIAHEINNPVNFVVNGSKAIEKDYQYLKELMNSLDISVEKKSKYDYDVLIDSFPQLISDVKMGANRIAEIVKGLNIFSRIEGSKKSLMNIHEGLDSTLVLLRHKTKGKIEIIKNYDLKKAEIMCYDGQLNQVFMNIISNAIDAFEEKQADKQIIISTKQFNETIIISISDNGAGISDSIKDKIFDPFFTTKEVGEGVGLGLSIVQGIVEQHGGKIEVRSKLNEGSHFLFSLPYNEKI